MYFFGGHLNGTLTIRVGRGCVKFIYLFFNALIVVVKQYRSLVAQGHWWDCRLYIEDIPHTLTLGKSGSTWKVPEICTTLVVMHENHKANH